MIDKAYYQKNIQTLAGIDEAGRGPLAGPCVVAGVILKQDHTIQGLMDSKQLSEKKRNTLFPVIIDEALAFKIEVISPEQIDQKNIYRATQDAMTDIALYLNADFTLTDAMPLNTPMAHEAIVKGDTLSETIAAASILAKVTRDKMMMTFHEMYPQYGFNTHKGYPTKKHLEALRQFGPCAIHRKTFHPVKTYFIDK